MSEYVAPPPPTRYAPHVLLATTIVAVLPVGASLALRAGGVISSSWLAMALAVATSVAASAAGGAWWKKRRSSGDILFSELLLWGWAVRWWQERQLANATKLLGIARSSGPSTLTAKDQQHLLRQLAVALETQDMYLHGHSRRVARHAVMIARSMGLDRDDVARIRAAAAVHDIGKLRTPVEILAKPAPLTNAEFEVIKRHPVDGAEMVAALGDEQLTAIVRHHHERIDGAGYPSGLVRDDIPLGARIVAVADTFDAITSARAYRPAARHKRAIDILRAETGSQLDPAAVRAFLGYYSGSRPLVIWAIFASALRRVVATLSGDPAGAATMSTGNVVATTAATAAVGVAAMITPFALVGKTHPARVADRPVAATTSTPRTPSASPVPVRHEVSRARPRPHTATARRLRRRRRSDAGLVLAYRSGPSPVTRTPPSSAGATPSAGGGAVGGGSTKRVKTRRRAAPGNRGGGNGAGTALADRSSDQGNGQGQNGHGRGGNNDASGHGKPVVAAPTSVSPPCRPLWRSPC